MERNFDPDARKGRKIMMIEMPNEADPIEPGTEGTITGVDGIGQIGVAWVIECDECFGDGKIGGRDCENCGGAGHPLTRSLSVIPGVDKYEIFDSMKYLKTFESFSVNELKQGEKDDLLDRISKDGIDSLTPQEKYELSEPTDDPETEPDQIVDIDSEGDIRIDGERMNPYGISDEFYDDGRGGDIDNERPVTPDLEKEIGFFLEEMYHFESSGLGYLTVVTNDTQETIETPDITKSVLYEFGISVKDANRIILDWYKKPR